MDLILRGPDSSDVPESDLTARVRELSDQLKQTTSSAQELAIKIAEAIRQERRAGRPYTPSKPERVMSENLPGPCDVVPT